MSIWAKHISNILVFTVLVFAVTILTACSSSSSSTRYGKKTERTERRDNSVRFSSAKEKDAEQKKDAVETEFDEEPVEDHPVNSNEFLAKYKNLKNLGVSLTARERVIFEVIDYLNTPYQYGGNTKKGIDCSGFTKQVFEKALGFALPRTASEQFEEGIKINSRSNLKFGDLVYFDTTREKYPGHVGIYLGNDLFVHSSVSKGVTVSSLESTYWKERYVGARRIEELFD